MTTKEQVRQVIERLPDDCTMEDVQYHLYVADLLRRRADVADRDPGVEHAEIRKRFAKWLID